MEVKNHRISGKNVNSFVKANTIGSEISPDTIVIHYTAGSSGDMTVRMFAASNCKLAAHLVAHENGTITQMGDFNRKLAHAGKSSYAGRTSYNQYSIGIEISNPGYLVKNKAGDGYLTWWEARKEQEGKTGKPVDPSMVFEGAHRNAKLTPIKYWHKYPQEQIDVVYEACKAICAEYDIKYILGHEEIAPGRKCDPGPAFPLDELRKKLGLELKDTVEKEEAKPVKKGTKGKTTAVLNVRQSPTGSAAKVSEALPKGKEVEILKESNGWYYINQGQEGWVAKDYVEQDNTDEEYDGVVTANVLNIRSLPSIEGKKVAQALTKGTKLDIIGQKDGWLNVIVGVNGWVSGKYIELKS